MADLDPLVAEILLKGDRDVLQKLDDVASQATAAFDRLAQSIASGSSVFQVFSDGIGLVEAAIAGASAAIIGFLEQQSELAQRTQLLAEAFGTQAGELLELEGIFAQSGVGVADFEKLVTRLTSTIAKEWPEIVENIRNYDAANAKAQQNVVESLTKVADAEKALGDNAAERASTLVKDTLASSEAYRKLGFAAQEAASAQAASDNSVKGAAVSLRAARLRLAELNGSPVTQGDKDDLALAQARLAVDQAEQAQKDALLKKAEQEAAAADKQKKLQQEAADAARKLAKDERDDAEQAEKDRNKVRDAIIAQGEAQDKLDKITLASIPNIRKALDGIVTGNQEAANSIDLTEVSVQNLRKAIIAQASEANGGGQPTGDQALKQFAQTLSSDTEGRITQAQRLALVASISSRSIAALGKTSAEVLETLENDAQGIEHLQAAASELDTTEARETIKAFRGELAQFELALTVLGQKFALAADPLFTAFLHELRVSLTDANGSLHIFIEGVKAFGSILYSLGSGIKSVIDGLALAIEKVFNFKPGTGLQIELYAVTALVTYFVRGILGIPGILFTIGTILGQIRLHWQEITAWAEQHRILVGVIGTALLTLAAGLAPYVLGLKAATGSISLMATGIGLLNVLGLKLGTTFYGIVSNILLAARGFNPWLAAIAAIGTGAVLIYENWDSISQAIQPTIDYLRQHKELLYAIEAITAFIAGAIVSSWLSGIGRVTTAVGAVGPAIRLLSGPISAIGSAFAGLGGTLGSLVSGAASLGRAFAFEGIIAGVGRALSGLVGIMRALTLATGPWGLAITAVGTLVYLLYENWDQVKSVIVSAWQALTDSSVISFLSPVASLLGNILKYLLGIKDVDLSSLIKFLSPAAYLLGKILKYMLGIKAANPSDDSSPKGKAPIDDSSFKGEGGAFGGGGAHDSWVPDANAQADERAHAYATSSPEAPSSKYGRPIKGYDYDKDQADAATTRAPSGATAFAVGPPTPAAPDTTPANLTGQPTPDYRGPGAPKYVGDNLPPPLAATLPDGDYHLTPAARNYLADGAGGGAPDQTGASFNKAVADWAKSRGGDYGKPSGGSTLNLTIGNKSFNGLSGPDSVINDLASYATSQQNSATGTQPDWAR